MTVVALDAMGGDLAPRSTVEGALRAAERGIEVTLVGDAEALDRELERHGGRPSGVRVMHAPDTIEMSEHASLETRRRRESSIYVAMELVKRSEADAFVSLGNTGAVLSLALAVLGRLPGVERPTLGVIIPRSRGPTLLLDVGANAESRPSHLVQFALLGVEYMRAVVGVEDPAVALLNLGEESTKGSQLTIAAHEGLDACASQSGLRFVGNVEGGDIVGSDVDVIVTDGFTGNVALKLIEAMVTAMFDELRDAARGSVRARVGGRLLRPALREIRERFDYRRYGGAPLLGVNGIVIIGHGRSDAEAVANAISTAAMASQRRLLEALAPLASDEGGASGEISGQFSSGATR